MIQKGDTVVIDPYYDFHENKYTKAFDLISKIEIG